jgi:DNA-binding NtrC family response regulator
VQSLCGEKLWIGTGVPGAATSLPVGCLIVDFGMPEMDGLELQQRLIDRALGFPMIVITGHGDVPLAVRANEGGRSRFHREIIRLAKRSSTVLPPHPRG